MHILDGGLVFFAHEDSEPVFTNLNFQKSYENFKQITVIVLIKHLESAAGTHTTKSLENIKVTVHQGTEE